jgi:hypothetical protein
MGCAGRCEVRWGEKGVSVGVGGNGETKEG